MTTSASKPELHPRPLSPHLQVYRPQITSVLSITHRMTGVVLAFFLMVLVGWLFALSHSYEVYECYQLFFDTLYGRLFLLAAWVSGSYHFLNGIRHLAWDAGYGYELKNAYTTGYIVVAMTLLSAALGAYILLG